MDHARLPTEVQLKDEIIHVLLKNACEKGRDACMRPTDIGRKIETYRLDYVSRTTDPLSRKHYDLLKELKRAGRVECVCRVWNESGTRRTRRWRLTKAEYNQLTLEE